MSSFQKSRLGLLPSDWTVRQVNQLMDEYSIIGHLDGNHGSDYPRSEEFVDTGIPYISANCLKDGQVNFGLAKYLHPDRARALRKGKARPGDVLFAHNATVGPVALLDSSSPLVILSTTLTYFRTDEKRLHNKYLKAFLESDHFRGQYEPLMAQSTRDQVPITVQRSFWIAVPPLPEQRKIAEILSTWDDAIATVDALLAALQRRKQGLMQRLLTGQVRFAEFEGSEWQNVRIGDVCRLVAGGTPSTAQPEYWAGNVPWMRSGDIHKRRIYSVDGRIGQEGLNNSSAELLPVNSVLVALAGQGKTRGSVGINKIELSTNQSVAAIVPDPSHLDYEYLFANLDFRYHELRQLSSGEGGRGGLNLTILKAIYLPKPSLAEQAKIGYVLGLCDQQSDLLEELSRSLAKQKKGLMQRLLTGQVRVGVGEEMQ